MARLLAGKYPMMLDELVILDFETTGLSPSYSRVIEVGAIIVRGTTVVDKLSQLMDPGCSIPYFITNLTGITNRMVKGQPSPEQVMPTLKKFIGDRPILAHNAQFDEKFLLAEMDNIDETLDNEFLCTLKLARRLIDNAPNHKLTTLISHLKISIPKEHKAHRALNDVLMTFQVWLHMTDLVRASHSGKTDLAFFRKLSNHAKHKVPDLFRS